MTNRKSYVLNRKVLEMLSMVWLDIRKLEKESLMLREGHERAPPK